MKNRSVCAMLTLLASTTLVLVSCAQTPATAPLTSSVPATGTSTPTAARPSTTPATESPKYGGVLNIASTGSVFQFDEAFTMTVTTGGFTQNEPAVGDWAKGPAGTNQASWTYSGNDRVNLKAGAVVESWEIEAGHYVFHVRKGVHYGLNPNNEASRLVNGRELTADDVAYSLQRLCTEPRAYLKNSYPKLAAGSVITAPDKYTVDIKYPVSEHADASSQWLDRNHIIAPEVAKKYGNVNKWDLQVGTGPFFMTDYVEGSSLTFVRNQNYWEKDPVGPGKGNQLPYVDSVKLLIIVDMSTAQAALRTAKIDQLNFATLDDAEGVTKNAQGLKSNRWLDHGSQYIAMHLYNPALPTSDVRVRRALMMATDFNQIKNQLYRGDAEIQTWPNTYQKEYASIFLPVKEAPASVQELYTYSPDKAKTLLKEAGYPNGFKSKIVYTGTSVVQSDFLEAVKSMWAKVGVDLELQPKEAAVYTNLWQSLTYEDMLISGGMGIGGYYKMNGFDTPSYWNGSQVNDAHVQEVKKQVYEFFNQGKMDQVDALYRDMMKYALDQAWFIPKPLPYQYTLWWPWVKNYHGELNVGWAGPGWIWTRYVWVDQDLKAKMTGR